MLKTYTLSGKIQGKS